MKKVSLVQIEQLRNTLDWEVKYRRGADTEYLFEVYVFLAMLHALTRVGYSEPHSPIHLDVQNQAPYFVPTVGGQDRKLGSAKEIAMRFVPSTLASRKNELLSIFYQGFPFIGSRLRPDITLMHGKVSTKIRQGVGHQLVEVYLQRSLEKEPKIVEVFTNILTPNGPLPAAYALARPTQVNPELIIEITTGKSIDSTRMQMKHYSLAFHPRSTVLATQDILGPVSGMADLVIDGVKLSTDSFFTLASQLANFFEKKAI